MEPRAGLRPGCTARAEPGDPDRQPAAAGAGVPVDSLRRLGATGAGRRRTPGCAPGQRRRAARAGIAGRTRRAPVALAQPGAGARSGRRRGECQRPGRGTGGEAADAGLGRAVGLALSVPHPSCLLPRRAAGGHRRDQPAAGRPRPDPGGRRAGVPLSPVRPRRLPAGRRRAGAGHLRSRRSGPAPSGRTLSRPKRRADGSPSCSRGARQWAPCCCGWPSPCAC